MSQVSATEFPVAKPLVENSSEMATARIKVIVASRVFFDTEVVEQTLSLSAVVFSITKVVGAIYLVWLGISLWRSAKTLQLEDLAGGKTSLSGAFKAEALVAASNLKAILIFAAFLPQFVVVDAYWQSFTLLGLAFLAMEAVAIFAYAAFGKFASKFASGKLPALQRPSGATMCLFGVLLLISPQPTRT